MSIQSIKNITILGGGTAGWMAAAALAKVLPTSKYTISLIEAQDIAPVGVGEATIPQILLFNKLLEINEDDFIRATKATFKLGIQFENWRQLGDKYIHAFGDVGKDFEGVPFYHYWLKLKQLNQAEDIDQYCLASLACHEKRFMRSVDAGNSPLSNIAYAYHFDAGLYGQYLKKYALQRGVKHIVGKVEQVQHLDNGHISGLMLNSGQFCEGDFFIDCSGFKGELIERTLKVGYQDWSHWLPCDSAITCQSELTDAPVPYTRSIAKSAGWQWQIPLQHRLGNGYVFASKYLYETEAEHSLLAGLSGKQLTDTRLIKFKTGKRAKAWDKNCLALGLANGFIEPLESTSIHLIQSTLAKLFSFFPDNGFAQADIDEFNRQIDFEMEKIRDFIILHYHVTERADSPFWLYCKTMDIPETLQQKIAQFKQNGRISRFNQEMFNELSWFEVMYGQGLRPKGYHALVDRLAPEFIQNRFSQIQQVIRTSVDCMPSHQSYIDDILKGSN